jgi:hypothetical protein
MNNSELIKRLKAEGYYDIRYIEGRGYCGLREFLFTIGLCYGLEENSYSGRYCYPKNIENDSHIALKVWNGNSDPVGGWVKHKGIEGEWSNPNINTSN